MEDKEFENKILNTIMVKQQILINDIFNIINEKYIEKSKIKDKIEELEEEKLCFYSDYAIEERNNKIQVLQELLKGE